VRVAGVGENGRDDHRASVRVRMQTALRA
jgi:hypothetical protein